MYHLNDVSTNKLSNFLLQKDLRIELTNVFSNPETKLAASACFKSLPRSVCSKIQEICVLTHSKQTTKCIEQSVEITAVLLSILKSCQLVFKMNKSHSCSTSKSFIFGSYMSSRTKPALLSHIATSSEFHTCRRA